MKKLTMLFTLLACAALFAVSAAAQDRRLVADIPFAFIVQHKTMPAGVYAVTTIGHQGSQFVLQGSNKNSAIVNMGTNEDGPRDPKLTFVRFGNEYVLAKIAPGYSAAAHSLGQSAIERNLKHKIGMTSMVTVPLRYQ